MIDVEYGAGWKSFVRAPAVDAASIVFACLQGLAARAMAPRASLGGHLVAHEEERPDCRSSTGASRETRTAKSQIDRARDMIEGPGPDWFPLLEQGAAPEVLAARVAAPGSASAPRS